MKMNGLIKSVLKGMLVATATALIFAPMALANDKTPTYGDVGVWRNKIYGRVEAENLDVNLENEMDNSAKSSFTVGGEILINDNWKADLHYASLKHEGTVNKAVRFYNTNFNASANLKMDVALFDLGFYKNMKKAEDTNFDLGFGVKFAKSEVDLTGTAAGVTVNENYSVTIPIPYFGIKYRSKISETVWGVVDGKYMSINTNKGKVTTGDFSFGVEIPFKKAEDIRAKDTEWSFGLGYRDFAVKGEVDDNNIRLGYKGVWGALMAKF